VTGLKKLIEVAFGLPRPPLSLRLRSSGRRSRLGASANAPRRIMTATSLPSLVSVAR